MVSVLFFSSKFYIVFFFLSFFFFLPKLLFFFFVNLTQTKHNSKGYTFTRTKTLCDLKACTTKREKTEAGHHF